MAGVVASNVRNQRAKSLSIKDTREDAEISRKLQLRQEQIESNNEWKRRLDRQSQNGSNSSVVLYLGLSVSSVGLIIFLVGVGDKGFKSLELQLIGPSLIGIGLLMAFFQILYCSKPWKRFPCLYCCGCKQKQESIKVKEKEHFNSAVIKIRSFNEFTRPQSRQQLGTINEFSRSNSTRRLSLGEVDG